MKYTPVPDELRVLILEQRELHLVSNHSSAASFVHPSLAESKEALEEAPVPGPSEETRDLLAFPDSEGRRLGFLHWGINE